MKLTGLEEMCLWRVSEVAPRGSNGKWYRAQGNGERVTLASLYRKGVLVRQVRRGKDGDPDAAYEYREA